MAVRVENIKISEAVELIAEKGLMGMAEAMQILFNEAMLIERANYLQLAPYERSEPRQDYANGFKPKQFKTRIGELSLQVPQVRSSEFYPSFLGQERGSDPDEKKFALKKQEITTTKYPGLRV